MADYLIQDTTLDDIADAINAKTGGSSAMTPAQMVTAIGSISSGGGGCLFVGLALGLVLGLCLGCLFHDGGGGQFVQVFGGVHVCESAVKYAQHFAVVY